MSTDHYLINDKGHDGEVAILIREQSLPSPEESYRYTTELKRASGAQTLDEISSRLHSIEEIIYSIRFFETISAKTGGVIKLDQKFGFFPVILREDGSPIPLYYFVEVIDELLDYQKLKEEFPELTFSQIENTLAFIRKLSAINMFNADIDELESEFDEYDFSLIQALQESITDGDKTRVLYNDK